MEVNGKCKEDFEKWYKNQHPDGHWYALVSFYNLAKSMQYGVYVDWFDSVGIHLVSYNIKGLANCYGSEVELANDREFCNRCYSSTRHEARTKAIEKAHEIYNDTLK